MLHTVKYHIVKFHNTTMGDAGMGTYSIEEQWHSKPRPLRIVSVGAGATGLLVAYKLKKEFENYELTIYEK